MMNVEQANALLSQAILTLPTALQQAIVAKEFRNNLSKIAERNGLSSSEELLAWQTLFVMAGFLPPSDFVSQVSTALEIPQEKAERICQEINETIFRPVREEIKMLYEALEESEHATGKKPLSAELEENVGLRKQFEAVKTATEVKRPLAAVLQDALRHPPTPPAPSSPTTPPLPPAAPLSSWGSQPQSAQAYQAQVSESHNVDAPEDEGPLDREEILRGIENPSTIHEPNELGNLNAQAQPPSGYESVPQGAQVPYSSTDPYREPLN